MRNIILASVFLVFSNLSFAGKSKAVIGDDSRIRSNDPKAARMSSSPFGGGGCSASLIGKTCMISAGHCLPTLYTAEFKTPHGNKVTGTSKALQQDFYTVDRKSIVHVFSGAGDEDWAVFRLKKHKKIGFIRKLLIKRKKGAAEAALYYQFRDGYYPGEIQGHYNVNFDRLNNFDFIRITGYGTDTDSHADSKSQQTALGFVTMATNYFDPEVFYHDVDSTKGNSGSGVLNADTNEIVGVHTFQECPKDPKSTRPCKNGGTSIYYTPKFAKAIHECLDWEATNL